MFPLHLLFAIVAVNDPSLSRPLAQDWDYAPAMRKVADRGLGRAGVVLHVGDSITYSNPYGQWAREGRGKTEDDKATLSWMHTGAEDDTDGWWLARFDHPEGGRSHTAAGGLRADELLAGGKAGLPSLEQLLKSYRPQAIVLMIGTNDAGRGRPVAEFRRDFERCVDLTLASGVVCVVSTIPPQPTLAREYSAAIRSVARSRSLPLIDFEREILRRRPDDWNGTLMGANDVHPTVSRDGVSPTSEPTPQNLRQSGYLLRGWLTVRKMTEVRKTVFEATSARQESTPLVLPQGKTVRLPVTRDTWFSEVGTEGNGNNGGSSKLKVKSYQEMSVIDIDPAPLKGKVVLGAELHVRLADQPILKRVTVGTLSADWTEGTGNSYEPQRGSSTFLHARHPDGAWALDGGDLCRVILGQGGTLWRMADASRPDANRWQTIPVDPLILSARVAGISKGFLVFDDTGSEWTRNGEEYRSIHMPNRFFASRESGPKDAPYFVVTLGAEDHEPPPPPTVPRVETKDLPAGEANVSWLTPQDAGPAGTVGFFVSLDGKAVPQSLVPRAGGKATMRIRDMGLKPGQEVALTIRAVDRAGNLGSPLVLRAGVSAKQAAELPGAAPRVSPPPPGQALPKVGNVGVAVIDELDKLNPETGGLIPQQPEGYLVDNHLWNARERHVRLHAARGEFVAFQVVLQGHDCQPSLTFDGPEPGKPRVEFGRYRTVKARSGLLPDPIVPIKYADSIVSPREKQESLHAEIFVPHDCAPGAHFGTLRLAHGGQSLSIKVTLRVWDFTLPDFLSFLPEMNCYGLPDDERDYYRLAHAHRTVLNRVPYSQRGEVAPGCAPGLKGNTFEWAEYDRRFGPYLDGSAFADLPRRGVPIECFYLPLHENWPTPIDPNYNGDYWADRAFTPKYRRDFVDASRQFAEHLNAKGWNETLFHCFFNGKNDFKRWWPGCRSRRVRLPRLPDDAR